MRTKPRLNQALVILFLILIASPIILIAQGSYSVRLKINQLEEDTIYIKTFYGDKTLIADTIAIDSHGYFVFETDKAHKGLATASLRYEDLFSFILDSNPRFSIEINPNGEAYIEGCDANQLFFEYQTANINYSKAVAEIRKGINKENQDSLLSLYNQIQTGYMRYQQDFFSTYPNHIMTSIIKSLKEPEIPRKFFIGEGLDTNRLDEIAYYFRMSFWNNFDFADLRLIQTPYFYPKFDAYFSEVSSMDPDSIAVSLRDLIVEANKRDKTYTYSKFAFEHHIKKYRNVPFSWHEGIYRNIIQLIAEQGHTPWLDSQELGIYKKEVEYLDKIAQGAEFPNIKGMGLDKNIYSLSDYSDKYLVVYFYSASCSSCKFGLDEFEEFYKEIGKDIGMEVIGIDLDYNESAAIEYAKERGFEWNTIKAIPEDIINDYGIDVFQTPDLYLLDNNRNILYHAPKYETIVDYLKRSEGLID